MNPVKRKRQIVRSSGLFGKVPENIEALATALTNRMRLRVDVVPQGGDLYILMLRNPDSISTVNLWIKKGDVVSATLSLPLLQVIRDAGIHTDLFLQKEADVVCQAPNVGTARFRDAVVGRPRLRKGADLELEPT